MLNYIWLAMVVLAVVLGGINGRIQEVTKAAIDSAAGAVTIAIGLIGVMALWLGIVKSRGCRTDVAACEDSHSGAASAVPGGSRRPSRHGEHDDEYRRQHAGPE